MNSGDYVSLRDVENSCAVTTFSKPEGSKGTNRHARTSSEQNDLFVHYSEIASSCHDAPYGWAPITNTGTTPSKVQNEPQYTPSDFDDDGMGIIESALYPGTFTAVNKPKKSQSAFDYSETGQKTGSDGIISPTSSDPLQRVGANDAFGNVVEDCILEDEDVDELKDEGYSTMHSISQPIAITSAADSKMIGHNNMNDDEPAETDEKDALKQDADNKQKEDIPAWMWEQFGDVAEFV